MPNGTELSGGVAGIPLIKGTSFFRSLLNCRVWFRSLKLLRSEAVHLSGCVVTADPLHCQKEAAQIITQEKGGDYVLGVKANPPTVRTNTEKKLAGNTPLVPRLRPTGAGAKTDAGLRNKNAACSLALLRTTLLRPVLRCGWGPTKTSFERVAARPSQGLELLTKRSFP